MLHLSGGSWQICSEQPGGSVCWPEGGGPDFIGTALRNAPVLEVL